MDYCKIGGRNYDVIVTEIKESYTILYTDQTGRTIAKGAKMTLDPLGTFFSHTVTFKRSKENVAEFDRLYKYLSKPRYNGIQLEIVHDQTTLKYEAYVSQGERTLKKISEKLNKVFWGEFSVNFIPMEAQIIPT